MQLQPHCAPALNDHASWYFARHVARVLHVVPAQPHPHGRIGEIGAADHPHPARYARAIRPPIHLIAHKDPSSAYLSYRAILTQMLEIDHNFSRAHQIVTRSILPVVEQYASHSRNVWEGSRFWKQFFESSANVSLSGYEEGNHPVDSGQDETASYTDETYTTDDHTITTQAYSEGNEEGVQSPSTSELQAATPTARSLAHNQNDEDELDLSMLSVDDATSTPKARGKAPSKQTEAFADYPSPYEEMRRNYTMTKNEYDDNDEEAPSTPTQQTAAISVTPESSPFQAPASSAPAAPSTARRGNNKNDVLLHRVLDKTYRVQATPHTGRRYANPSATKPKQSRQAATATPRTTSRRNLLDSSPMTPGLQAPQLHSEIFSSPIRGGPPSAYKSRTPGVSVMTPGRKKNGDTPGKQKQEYGWNSDDEEDEIGWDESPPKTMHFHVPASRLLQTPGKSLLSFSPLRTPKPPCRTAYLLEFHYNQQEKRPAASSPTSS